MEQVNRTFVTLLVVVMAATSTLASTSESVIKTEPPSKKEATGRQVTITCTGSVNSTLLWKDPNDNIISTNGSLRVHVEEPAILKMNDLNVNDTGTYTCFSDDGLHNATTTLVVYIMPSYFFEGMVILFVNLGLIVIFFGCLVHAFIKSRRQKSKQEKAELKQGL